MVHGSCLFTHIIYIGEQTGAMHHRFLKGDSTIESEVQNTSLSFFTVQGGSNSFVSQQLKAEHRRLTLALKTGLGGRGYCGG